MYFETRNAEKVKQMAGKQMIIKNHQPVRVRVPVRVLYSYVQCIWIDLDSILDMLICLLEHFCRIGICLLASESARIYEQ